MKDISYDYYTNLPRECMWGMLCTMFGVWQALKKKKKKKKKKPAENSPGGTVVKTPSFQCGGVGLIPGQGTRIPHVTQHSQKTKSKLKI